MICRLMDFDVVKTLAVCIDRSPKLPVEGYLDIYYISSPRMNHLERETFGRTYFMLSSLASGERMAKSRKELLLKSHCKALSLSKPK